MIDCINREAKEMKQAAKEIIIPIVALNGCMLAQKFSDIMQIMEEEKI